MEHAEQEAKRRHKRTLALLSWLILLIGISAFCLILTQGISTERQSKQMEFERVTQDIVRQFERAFENYVQAGLWLHETCFEYHDKNKDGGASLVPHVTFQKHLYPLFLQSNAKMAHPISIIVNTSHTERERIENSTRAYLQKRNPSYNYLGVTQMKPISTDGVNHLTELPVKQLQTKKPFYLLVRLIAPIFEEQPTDDYNDEDLIDMDLSNDPDVLNAFSIAVQTGKPRIMTPMCFDALAPGKSATFSCAFDILHPGAQRYNNDAVNKDLGSSREAVSDVSVWVNDLFSNVNQIVNKRIRLYLFDNMVEEFTAEASPQQPMLIGAAQLWQRVEGAEGTYPDPTYLPLSNRTSVDTMIQQYTYITHIDRQIFNRNWSFVFVAALEDFPPQTKYIILGASMILVACLGLVVWVHTDHRRRTKMEMLQTTAQAEKAALKVENARLTARKERELNDFIAHEVRNPISAALSACSFLTTAVQEGNNASGSWTRAKRKAMEEDVNIIDSSLNFINDLLRNMLDLHRTQSNQLKLNPTPLSVHADILQPVAAMLRQHGQPFSVLVECDPQDLVIHADKLRLKQIVLNLGRNSVKFVTKGYVRLKAQVSKQNAMVELLVEDSGPGIPMDKRSRLFSKFQESLDSLHQGTGIGLSLCQMLIDLMGGEIKLDDGFNSGIPGFLGASFVIKLNTPPLALLPEPNGDVDDTSSSSLATFYVEDEKNDKQHSLSNNIIVLPEKLSVLICDDDMMLRKMFLRSLKRVAPLWDLSEAANGETGLQLARKTKFDIIFLDQYMASVSKQMLGTETAMAMRSAGITSVLCGLSANDMEKSFLDAGADAFIMKPFPCNPDPLKEALAKVVQHLPPGEQLLSKD